MVYRIKLRSLEMIMFEILPKLSEIAVVFCNDQFQHEGINRYHGTSKHATILQICVKLSIFYVITSLVHDQENGMVHCVLVGFLLFLFTGVYIGYQL